MAVDTNNKLITLGQLQKLAAKAKKEIAAGGGGGGGSSAGGVDKLITLTISTSDWAGSTATKSDENLVADTKYCYIVGADSASVNECSKCDVTAGNIAETGSIMFSCATVPTKDVTLYVLRIEVGA